MIFKFILSLTLALGIANPLTDKEDVMLIANKCQNPQNEVQYVICAEFPILNNLTDQEAIGVLREIVYSEVNFISTSVYKLNPTFEIKEEYPTYLHYRNNFKNLKKGALCGATSTALATLYRDFGLNAETYNFGTPKNTATHVVTVVKLNDLWYWQDATYDYELSFDSRRLEPVPINKILSNLGFSSKEFNIFLFANNYIGKNTRFIQTTNDRVNCQEKVTLSRDIEFCRTFEKKDFSDLFKIEKYVSAINTLYPNSSKELDSRIFLNLSRLPIGNNPEINCLIANQCLDFASTLF